MQIKSGFVVVIVSLADKTEIYESEKEKNVRGGGREERKEYWSYVVRVRAKINII